MIIRVISGMYIVTKWDWSPKQDILQMENCSVLLHSGNSQRSYICTVEEYRNLNRQVREEIRMKDIYISSFKQYQSQNKTKQNKN